MTKLKKPAKKIPKEYAGLIILILFSMFIKLFALTNGEIIYTDKAFFPVLITGLVIFLIYDIGYTITRNMRAGLFSAALAAFIPLSGLGEYNILITSTILFFLFTLFLFSHVEKEKKWPIFLLVPTLFAIISDCSLFLVIVLGLFYILTKLLNYPLTNREAQYIALTGIILLLVSAIADKNPFSLFQTGYVRFVANFLSFNKLTSIAGIFPIILGLIGTVLVFFKTANKFGVLILSNMVVFGILLLVSPLKFNFVLPLFLISLSCLGAVSYKWISCMLRKSKLQKHTEKIMLSLFFIIIYFAIRHWLIVV